MQTIDETNMESETGVDRIFKAANVKTIGAATETRREFSSLEMIKSYLKKYKYAYIHDTFKHFKSNIYIIYAHDRANVYNI